PRNGTTTCAADANVSGPHKKRALRNATPFLKSDLKSLTTSGLVVEYSHVAALADDVAVHCFQNIGARRASRKIQLGIERVKFKNVVVSRTALRRAGRLITVHATNIFALHSTVIDRSNGLGTL